MATRLPRIAIIGAGGNSREIRWLIDDINSIEPSYEFAGYVVSDPEAPGRHDDRENTVGSIDELLGGGLSIEVIAIGIADPAIRFSMGQRFTAELPAVAMPRLVHPSVQMDVKSSTLGQGTIVCAGAIVSVNVTIEDFAMINRACNIGHEAAVGSGVVINPLASISGGVVLGDRVLVGTAAVVLQYVVVGHDATVGAGSVVTKDVQNGKTVVGVPAQPMTT